MLVAVVALVVAAGAVAGTVRVSASECRSLQALGGGSGG
jgi:hypothetical protein